MFGPTDLFSTSFKFPIVVHNLGVPQFWILPGFALRCRQETPGIKGKEIETMWKASSERAAVLTGVSEKEQKRRRYI